MDETRKALAPDPAQCCLHESIQEKEKILPEALLLYYTTILSGANKDRINSTKKAASAASPGDTAIEEYHRTASELIIREIIINLDPGNLPVMAFPPYVTIIR